MPACTCPATAPKTKATDTADHLSDEKSVSVALLSLLGGVVPANLVSLSEKPFVCLKYFRLRKNTFTPFDREQSFALILRQPSFDLCCRGKREEMQNPRKRDSSIRTSEPFSSSVKPFVRPRIFARRKYKCSFGKRLLLFVRQRPFSGVKCPTFLKKRQPTQLFFLL